MNNQLETKDVIKTKYRLALTTKADMEKTYEFLQETGLEANLNEFRIDISSGQIQCQLWLRDYNKRYTSPYITFEFGFNELSAEIWGEIYSYISNFCKITSWSDDVTDLEIVMPTRFQADTRERIVGTPFVANLRYKGENNSIQYNDTYQLFQTKHHVVGRISLGYHKKTAAPLAPDQHDQMFVLRIEGDYLNILQRIASVFWGSEILKTRFTLFHFFNPWLLTKLLKNELLELADTFHNKEELNSAVCDMIEIFFKKLNATKTT